METTKYLIPGKINLALSLTVVFVMLFQFFLLPLYLIPVNVNWAWLIVPLIPLNNVMWFLIHESIHKNFHPNRTVNDIGGRVLGIFFGSSFNILLFGHTMHHKLNRDWDSENYYVTADSSDLVAVTKYYMKIFFGVYFIEVISGFLMSLLNRKWVLRISSRQSGYNRSVIFALENYFYLKKRVDNVRADTILIFGFYTCSLIAYGAYWPIFVALILLRAMSISLMDNVFHYGTEHDNSVPGKVVYAGKATSALLMYSNYHGLHHSNADIPWIFLPYEAEKRGLRFEGSFIQAMRAQLSGPNIVRIYSPMPRTDDPLISFPLLNT